MKLRGSAVYQFSADETKGQVNIAVEFFQSISQNRCPTSVSIFVIASILQLLAKSNFCAVEKPSRSCMKSSLNSLLNRSGTRKPAVFFEELAPFRIFNCLLSAVEKEVADIWFANIMAIVETGASAAKASSMFAGPGRCGF